MVYLGKVENGMVRLDNGHELPDGTRVRVEEVLSVNPPDSGGYEELLAHAGTIKSEAVFKGACVHPGDGHRKVLDDTANIGEAQIDFFDACFGSPFE